MNKRAFKFIIPIVVLVFAVGLFSNVSAARPVVKQNASPTPFVSPTPKVKPGKVNICHKTRSVKNPYVAIRISEKAFDGEGNDHKSHEGDFLYMGPLNGRGAPTRDGKNWCKQQALPQPSPSPSPSY